MTLSLSKPFFLGGTSKEMSKYFSFLSLLADGNTRDETKLKAATHLRENILDITLSSQRRSFVDSALNIFNKVLIDGTPEFLAETHSQRLRKLILEMITYFTFNNLMEAYADDWASNMMTIAMVENETNAVLALNIFHALNRLCHPPFNSKLLCSLMMFAQEIYSELPSNISNIFDPNQRHIKINTLPTKEVINYYLEQIHMPADIRIEQPATSAGGTMVVTLLPKSRMSVKVLVELPRLMNFLLTKFTNNINIRKTEVFTLFPTLHRAVLLQPPLEHQTNPAFCKELYIEFLEAQVNTLGLLIHLVHYVNGYGTAFLVEPMIKGILHLLAVCPKQAVDLRQHLVFYSYYGISQVCKHNSNAVELFSYMEALCNEKLLLGQGWSSNDSLTCVAYRLLSSPLKFVKNKLPTDILMKIVHRFTTNLLDESRAHIIQRTSAEALADLIPTVVACNSEDNTCQNILIQLLEILIAKFKLISKIHITQLKTLVHTQNIQKSQIAETIQPEKSLAVDQMSLQQITQTSFQPQCDLIVPVHLTEMNKFSLKAEECASLVKALVDLMKVVSCSGFQWQQMTPEANSLLHWGTTLYSGLMKWGSKCLEINTIEFRREGWVMPNQMKLKKLEENREVATTFTSAFFSLHPLSQKAVFNANIEQLVHKILEQPELMIIVDKFLNERNTLQQFATVMLEFVLSRIDKITDDEKKRVLYLILSSKVFIATMKNEDNHHIVVPFSFTIVSRCMELVNAGKEPYYIFLFLRTFFRNLSSKHELIYKEFKPLIPSLFTLFKRFNCSDQHQYMKNLAVELCLSVPLRLCEWMEYIHLLIALVVTALQLSKVDGKAQVMNCVSPPWNTMWHELVIAPRNIALMGLNTLDMCVSHLPPEYINQIMNSFPLLQALTDIMTRQFSELHFPVFRTLGKLGGVAQTAVYQPQKLEYCKSDLMPPSVDAFFTGHPEPIPISVDKIIDAALTMLKNKLTEANLQTQCWDIIRCVLISSVDFRDDPDSFEYLFTHSSFSDPNVDLLFTNQVLYKFCDSVTRETQIKAFVGMFIAACIPRLQVDVMPTLRTLVSYYTLIAVSQQAGPLFQKMKVGDLYGLDSLILCDALVELSAMGDTDKYPIRDLGVKIIIKVVVTIMGTLDRACKLPFIEYLTTEMMNLCYKRAWFTKDGGYTAVQLLFNLFGLQWRCKHLLAFVKAMFYILKCPVEEVASANVKAVKLAMEDMLSQCVRASSGYDNNDAETVNAQYTCIFDVCRELVQLIVSQHTTVREQAMSLLHMMARVRGLTLTQIIEPHKEVLQGLVPPSTHSILCRSLSAQIGIIEGNAFCQTLLPPVFNVSENTIHFFNDLLSICMTCRTEILTTSYSKIVPDLGLLRKTALQALLPYCNIQECQEKTLTVLYKLIDDDELHQSAYECIQTLCKGQFEVNTTKQLLKSLRSLIASMKSGQNQLTTLHRLQNLIKLVPIDSRSNDTICKILITHLRAIVDDSKLCLYKGAEKAYSEASITVIMDILSTFNSSVCHQLLHPLYTLQRHLDLKYITGSPLKIPLMKFLLMYPQQTVEMLLSENAFKDETAYCFLEYIIKHKNGQPFHSVFKGCIGHIEALIVMNMVPSQENNALVQYRAIRLLALVLKYDAKLLEDGHSLVNKLKIIWYSDAYREKHNMKTEDKIPTYWKEPKYIVKILLHYFNSNPSEIDILFELLKAHCGCFCCNFQFLRDYLDNTVAQHFTVYWKRLAFFFLANNYNTLSNELKAKAIECVLFPSFAESFRLGETDQLMGEINSHVPNEIPSLVSVFVSKMIEAQISPDGADNLKLQVIKFACLLMEHAGHQFKVFLKGAKMRVMMLYVWPYLVEKKYQDKHLQYHGHVLLAYICVTFKPQKRVVIPVLFSLLKACDTKVQSIVHKALGILIPWIFNEMENGPQEIIHLTCKALSDATVKQHMHILDVVLQHSEIYYSVRQYLYKYIVAAINFCGPSPLASFAYKRQVVSLVDMLLRWELKAKEEISHITELDTKRKNSETDDEVNISPKKKRHSENEGVDFISVSDTNSPNLLINNSNIATEDQLCTETFDKPSIHPQPYISKDSVEMSRNDNEAVNVDIQNSIGTVTEQCAAVQIPESCKPVYAQNVHFLPSLEVKSLVVCQSLEKSLENDANKLVSNQSSEHKYDSISDAVISSSPSAHEEPITLGITKPENKLSFKDVSQDFIYFLLLLPCELNVCGRTQKEMTNLLALSRRCIYMLRVGFKEKIFPDDLKIKSLTELTRVLNTVDSPNVNRENIWSTLSVINLLMDVLKKENILALIQPLQTHLLKCATSSNKRIAKCTQVVLVKLVTIFPIEFAGVSIFSVYEELKTLYSNIGGLIFDGLTLYQDATASSSQLYSTLLLLETCFKSKPSYINTHMAPLSKVVQILARRHVDAAYKDELPITNELLYMCMKLIREKVLAIGPTLKQVFIGTVLGGLIENSNDPIILENILKIVESWVEGTNMGQASSSIDDKTSLIFKLMQNIRERFADNVQLNDLLLNVIFRVYSNEHLQNSDLTTLLMPGFYHGLNYPNITIRSKFMNIFHTFMAQDLPGRLVHITCTENWDEVKSYFWIKACIELVCMTAIPDTPLCLSDTSRLLPRIPSVICVPETDVFGDVHDMKTKLEDFTEEMQSIQDDDDVAEISFDTTFDASSRKDVLINIKQLSKWLTKMFKDVTNVHTVDFLNATVLLCHRDTDLAKSVWLDIFPKVWSVMTPQQQRLACKLQSYFRSYEKQSSCNITDAMRTYIDGLLMCCPCVMEPSMLKYIGSHLNLWHSATLALEYASATADPSLEPDIQDSSFNSLDDEGVYVKPPYYQVILQGLVDMYTLFNETDMLAGLMHEYAYSHCTIMGLTYEQHNMFELAKTAYVESMGAFKDKYGENSIAAPFDECNEQKICFERYWTKCAVELHEWKEMYDVSMNKYTCDLWWTLESAWRMSQWDTMKDIIEQQTEAIAKEYKWKVNLYHGYVSLAHTDDGCCYQKALTYCRTAAMMTVHQWQSYPTIRSQIHLPMIQASQFIIELQETCNIHKLMCSQQPSPTRHNDVIHLLNTWKSRMPRFNNDLNYSTHIVLWRQTLLRLLIEKLINPEDEIKSEIRFQCELASFQAQNYLSKVFRKQNLLTLSQAVLPEMKSISSKLMAECYMLMLNQQVKTYMQSNEEADRTKCLEVINNVNVEYFSNEMLSDYLTMKATVNHLGDFSLDSYKLYSTALELNETSHNVWRLWGEHTEAVFYGSPMLVMNASYAIQCFMNACKHLSEVKAKRYLAKVLWLLSYDNDGFVLMRKFVECLVLVPLMHWLPWIPQLMTMVRRTEGKFIIQLLGEIFRIYPQGVYFPLRALCSTLKNEVVTHISNAQNQTENVRHTPAQDESSAHFSPRSPEQANPLQWCHSILCLLKEKQPSKLATLETIADELENFQLSWYEHLLTVLQENLAQSLAFAFESKVSLTTLLVPIHMVLLIKKMVSFFGCRVDDDLNSNPEFLSLRSLAMFKTDFECKQGVTLLSSVIQKLRKWIIVIKRKLKTRPRSYLLENKAKYLSNFNLETEELFLPGEYQDSKLYTRSVRIASFLPHVEVIEHQGRLAHQLKIRGTDGKVHAYAVIISSSAERHRKEERVMQLLRMINSLFVRDMGTFHRCLSFSVPRVVTVSPNIRLIEVDQSAVTLEQIYQNMCHQSTQDPNTVLDRYYEFAGALAEGGMISTVIQHRILVDIYREIQRDIISPCILRDWAEQTFPTAPDYWTFRKMVTTQMALLSFAEHVFNLTQLDPSMIVISQEFGFLYSSNYAFDIESASGKFASKIHVPFRLTPNFTEFMTPVGVKGPFTAAMTAIARCLMKQEADFQAILRAILRDEVIFRQLKIQRAETVHNRSHLLIEGVARLELEIFKRLSSIAVVDSCEVPLLISTASSLDNLCHMNPTWNPWL